MKKEPLTKEEFDTWKDNHFDTLYRKVVVIDNNVKWIKWLFGTALLTLLGRVVLLFFGI